MKYLSLIIMVLGVYCFAVLAPTRVAADPVVTLSVSQTGSAPVTLTTTVQGITQPQYEYWAKTGTTGWQKIGNISDSATYLWTPTKAATYTFMVCVSDKATGGQSIATSRSLAVVVPSVPTPPTYPTLKLSTTTLKQMSPVTLTASARATGTLEYAFAVLLTSGGQTTWQVVRTFATSSTYTWTPTIVGTYSVMALIRVQSTPVGQNPIATVAMNCTVTAAGSLPTGDISVAQYAGDRSAAVSYTWDDGMICQTDTVAPMFSEFGLHASFYIVTSWIMENNNFTNPEGPGDWAGWRRVLAAGHEVGNHSLSHQNLTSVDSSTLQEEVNGSIELIQQHLGITPLTFAYPFNAWNSTTRQVVLERHVWDREQQISLTTENFTLSYANGLIDTAIAQHTWIVPNGHGVDGYGWSPISSSILRQHLSYVKSRANVIWVDTAANVARYLKERDTAQIQLQSSGNGRWVFTLQCPGLDTSIYTVPLTMKLSTGTSTASSATAIRGTTSLPVTIKAGYILVDVTPGSGSVTVTYQ